MKTLIFDPFGGASGDMILGSLIHLGCPTAYLTEIWDALQILNIPSQDVLRTEWKSVHAVNALDLKFSLPEPASQTGRRRKKHTHDQAHAAPVRSWRNIREILERAAIPEAVRERSLHIFTLLAEAEAAVHGTAPDDVHFHEIGAIDSLLDIVGIAAAVAWFQAEAFYTTPVPVGRGSVVCRHGRLPLPAPATVNLLEGLPVRFTAIEGELTTPTGAAVLKALATGGPPPTDVILRGTGYGCGDHDYGDWPNLFRTLLADTVPGAAGQVYVVETDVDDMSPEDWELATGRLFAAGALDVTLTARLMKRGRPGVGLKVLVPAAQLSQVVNLILIETSSIGVRYYPVARQVLPRRTYPIRTKYGELRIKEVVTPEGEIRHKPEYADLQALAVANNLPVSRLRKEVEADLLGLSSQPSAPIPQGSVGHEAAPPPEKKAARRRSRSSKSAAKISGKEKA